MKKMNSITGENRVEARIRAIHELKRRRKKLSTEELFTETRKELNRIKRLDS